VHGRFSAFTARSSSTTRTPRAFSVDATPSQEHLDGQRPRDADLRSPTSSPRIRSDLSSRHEGDAAGKNKYKVAGT